MATYGIKIGASAETVTTVTNVQFHAGSGTTTIYTVPTNTYTYLKTFLAVVSVGGAIGASATNLQIVSASGRITTIATNSATVSATFGYAQNALVPLETMILVAGDILKVNWVVTGGAGTKNASIYTEVVELKNQ